MAPTPLTTRPQRRSTNGLTLDAVPRPSRASTARNSTCHRPTPLPTPAALAPSTPPRRSDRAGEPTDHTADWGDAGTPVGGLPGRALYGRFVGRDRGSTSRGFHCPVLRAMLPSGRRRCSTSPVDHPRTIGVQRFAAPLTGPGTGGAQPRHRSTGRCPDGPSSSPGGPPAGHRSLTTGPVSPA